MKTKQIFIVDDDFDTINSVSMWLRHKRYEARCFSGSKHLFEGLARSLPDAILLDINLMGEDGRDVCKEIRKHYADRIPIILFSMMYQSIKEVKDSCADDFIKKDASLHEITELLKGHMKVEDE